MNNKFKNPGNLTAAMSALALAALLLALITPSSLLATPGSAVAASYADALTQSSGAASAAVANYANNGPASGKSGAGQTPDQTSFTAQPAIASETIPPVITNLVPADGSMTGTTVNFSADYSDPAPSSGLKLSTAMLHIDNHHQFGSIVSGTGITCLKSGLANGNHKIEAFICDNDMNCSKATWYITVDAIPPVISNTLPTGLVNSAAPNITATLSDTSGSGVDPASAAVSIDGSPASGCTASGTSISCHATGLPDGVHTVRLSVSDRAGNPASTSWNFTVDTAAVGVTGQTPAAGTWQTTTTPHIGVSFQPVGTNAVDAASVTVLLDGVDVSSSADRQPDGMNFTPPASLLTQGLHDVTVTVSDVAGHSGRSEWSFGIDSAAPQITGATPRGAAGTSRPTIAAGFNDSGSGINPLSVNLSVDGVNQTGASTISGSGISYTPAENLAAGSHNVQLTVADLAGNQQISAWSFSVPQPPASGQPAPPRVRTMTMYEYWQSTGGLAGMGMGSWIVSGFQAFPNIYYLPWYDSGPASAGVNDEIVIRNQGAGEAFVNVLVGGAEKWQGKIPEGGTQICQLPGTTGGPVKIVCPTGQPLDVNGRLTAAGDVSETAAVPEDALEPAVELPWFDSNPGSSGASTLVIANAGGQDAAVDVYIGDPSVTESLKGRYSIGTGSALRAQLPETNGGPVRIVASNGQPLVAAIETSVRGSIEETLATGLTHLSSHRRLEPATRRARLFLGNGNGEDRRVQISAGGQAFHDPANPDNDFLLLPGWSAQAIDISSLQGPLDIDCADCSLGEGISVGTGL